MEKFFVKARNKDKGNELRKKAERIGFNYSEEPDFVISYGGDGTFLESEREWPGIPKLLVRDSMICFKCHDEPAELVLKKIKEGKFNINECIKIEASIDGKSLVGVNDIVVRNHDPRRALRFRIKTDNFESEELIGDGVVIATPFGSTGYYHAITRDSFDSGIGLAFNNTTKEMKPMKFSEDSEIHIEIVREEGLVVADNSPDEIIARPGKTIMIRKSGEVARIISHMHDKKSRYKQ